MSHRSSAHHKSSWEIWLVTKDPIVEEVHETRRRLLEEYGGMDGYFRHIKELELELKDRVVRREPRRPVVTKQKAS
jgi:hypothetical protein